mmetsp:Transcript_113575/g.366963  ORF Transcript_113575/g.366963 Transcript_113575/m.366963 type:complete len:237 (+) Transcript_113575:900-1610(+)
MDWWPCSPCSNSLARVSRYQSDKTPPTSRLPTSCGRAASQTSAFCASSRPCSSMKLASGISSLAKWAMLLQRKNSPQCATVKSTVDPLIFEGASEGVAGLMSNQCLKVWLRLTFAPKWLRVNSWQSSNLRRTQTSFATTKSDVPLRSKTPTPSPIHFGGDGSRPSFAWRSNAATMSPIGARALLAHDGAKASARQPTPTPANPAPNAALTARARARALCPRPASWASPSASWPRRP